MKPGSVGRFAVVGGFVALLAAAPVVAWTWSMEATFMRWSLAGWLIMTVVGLVGGAWMALEHGRPTVGFIVALGACMLSRLIVSAAGAFAAAAAGERAVLSYVAGLGVGYVPLQIFETVWFMKRDRSRS